MQQHTGNIVPPALGRGIVAGLVAGCFTHVQAGDAPEAELVPLTVTATRTERRVDDVPASVSVISREDIAAQQPLVASDLLRNVEGVDVTNYGSLGSNEPVTIRGVGGSFGGSTSQILIDGMPLESPITGIHFGMKALAVQDIERIEVVRGPAAALYGPSAVGGVVNLMSRRWAGAAGAELSVGGGSHGTTQVAAALGSASDVADFRLSASDLRTDGYVAQPEPDRWGNRDLGPRDGKDRKFGLTAGLRPADNQEITLAVRDADVRSAWLGGHPNYRINAKVRSHDLGYRYEAGDWGVFRFRYRGVRQESNLLFDADYYGISGDLSLADIEKRVDRSDTVDMQADLRLGRNDVLTLGVSHGSGRYEAGADYVMFGFAEQSASKSRMTGLFIQDEHRFSDALTVLVGGRRDRYSFYGDSVDGVATGRDSSDSVFNPRLGARYRLDPATSLYATAGTAYVPALNILKFRSGGSWLDNPDLKPERSATVEIGANHRRGPLAARASIYRTDYRDKIEAIDVGQQRQFSNVGQVVVDGLELAVETVLAGGWRPYLNYAHTNSRIRTNPADPQSEGKRLQRVAPNKLNLGVIYAPSERYYLRLAGRHVDAYYFNDRNTADARNPGHFVADAKIGWRLPAGGAVRRAELTLAVNNLFDKRYSEQQYETMDGRNVWLGLNAAF